MNAFTNPIMSSNIRKKKYARRSRGVFSGGGLTATEQSSQSAGRLGDSGLR